MVLVAIQSLNSNVHLYVSISLTFLPPSRTPSYQICNNPTYHLTNQSFRHTRKTNPSAFQTKPIKVAVEECDPKLLQQTGRKPGPGDGGEDHGDLITKLEEPWARSSVSGHGMETVAGDGGTVARHGSGAGSKGRRKA